MPKRKRQFVSYQRKSKFDGLRGHAVVKETAEINDHEENSQRHERPRQTPTENSPSPNFPCRDIDRLYAARETVECALGECIPCCYKVGNFDVARDKEFCRMCPNQRPEQCPRAKTARQTIVSLPDKNNASTQSVMGIHRGMNILCVGDGDFSFSLGLARRLSSQGSAASSAAGHHSSDKTTWIVATSYEKKSTLRNVYPDRFDETVLELEALGVTIVYEVDATRIRETLIPLLPDSLKSRIFHRVFWNFPCTAISRGQDGQNSEMDDNKRLVQGFVKSASSVLSKGDGELCMAHKTKPPYNQWKIQEVALSEQCDQKRSQNCGFDAPFFHYAGKIVMDRCLIPPYTPRKALDRKSFPCHDACFYIFSQDPLERASLTQKRRLFPPSIPNVQVAKKSTVTQQSSDMPRDDSNGINHASMSPSPTRTSHALMMVDIGLITAVRAHHLRKEKCIMAPKKILSDTL
ncbi:MAG: hypothetical protein SGILL_007349 [Bacillariaceae sp.]